MVDRILHIGHKLAPRYNKEIVQRATEIAINKGVAAVVPFLTETEKWEPIEAAKLAGEIATELRRVNRQVLLLYAIIALFFLVLLLSGLYSRSFIFAGLFALPVLKLLHSIYRFVRRNVL